MMNNLTYIARGNPNQLSNLMDTIKTLLDSTSGVQRSYEAARTLDVALAAEPPRPEEVNLPPDSEFVRALRSYHATKFPVQQTRIEQGCETDKPCEWYIEPVFSFSGTVAVAHEGYDNHVPVAAEVAGIIREGTIKIDHNPDETPTELTLTLDYTTTSALSLRILAQLEQIFANAQCQGINIDQQ